MACGQSLVPRGFSSQLTWFCFLAPKARSNEASEVLGGRCAALVTAGSAGITATPGTRLESGLCLVGLEGEGGRTSTSWTGRRGKGWVLEGFTHSIHLRTVWTGWIPKVGPGLGEGNWVTHPVLCATVYGGPASGPW